MKFSIEEVPVMGSAVHSCSRLGFDTPVWLAYNTYNFSNRDSSALFWLLWEPALTFEHTDA